MENYNINVYEIDESDFIAFCKENFSRLLNRQIKKHTETKVWVMYQGGNFNHGNSIIKPANESGLWCPTENLTGFELSIGDRILFIKTNGASTQVVQKEYFKNNIIDKWFLSQIYVGEIKSAIYSRGEYCSFRQIPNKTQLWLNDEIKNNIWRWNRVFEFYNIKTIDTNIEIKELYKNKLMHEFIIALVESFCYQRSREISLKQYRDLLEFLLK